MGRHSVNSGSPFGRKHTSLGHAGRSTRSGKSFTPLPEGPKKPGRRPVSRKQGVLEAAPARLQAEREMRSKRRRRIAVGFGATVALLILGLAAAGFIYAKRLENTMQVTKVEKLSVSLAKAKPQEPYTVLLLGGDKRPGETVYRSDTMILAKIDPKTQQMWMLSIPRDTKVQVPGHGSMKINQAFSVGGPEASVKAVKSLTGVPINHYMQVDFVGFSKVVDAMGGVWVDVPVDIDDWQASSHSYKHRAAKIDKGFQLLDGEHALTFVRARHQFIDQDFSRMKNQQIFFKALADQVADGDNVLKIPRIISTVAPYIQTDMTLMEMLRTAQAMRTAGSKRLYTATVPGVWRSPYIYHDEKKLADFVKKMKAGVSFEATSVPDPKSKSTKSSDVKPAVAKKPSAITLTVRNGGGVAGSAKQCSSILAARGFKLKETGNANQFLYKETLVVYKSDKAAAELVASALPPGAKIVESRGMYSFKTDVLVVIGKDWNLAKVPIAPVGDSN